MVDRHQFYYPLSTLFCLCPLCWHVLTPQALSWIKSAASVGLQVLVTLLGARYGRLVVQSCSCSDLWRRRRGRKQNVRGVLEEEGKGRDGTRDAQWPSQLTF